MPMIWGRVPQQNKNFTGRKELLETLRNGLNSEPTAVLPHALHGLGGVGKTQLAIEYAHRYRHQYDLVWWIPADQPMLVKSSLAGLARELRLPIAVSAGTEDAAQAALDALRRGEPYANWLLIFDNADDPEEINDIIPRGPGHVLITSRNHSWESVVDTVAVDVFKRSESIEFLLKRVRLPKETAERQADRLAEALGDLPLALEQAGALMAETGMSVDEYLRQLEEQTTRLLGVNKPQDYPLSMTAAWALSVSQLRDRMPEAVELLRCCAFFGPEPIPRDLFDPLPPDFSAGSRLADMLADPIKVSQAVRELGRYALVRIDSESRTLQVHRLVQALLRDELEPAERRAYQREVHLLLAAATAAYEPDVAWHRYGGLIGHVTPSDVAGSRDPKVRRFALNVVRYLYSSGDFKSAGNLVGTFIERWRAESGEDDQFLLSAQRHRAIVIRELGEIQLSFQLNRDLLERMRRVLGEDHEETLLITNSHGADLRFRGDFAAALRHDEESLRRHQEVFGPHHRRTLRVMNNLALDYLLLGDYAKAQELQARTFTLQRQAGSGASKQNVLSSWNGLARLTRLSGRYREACDIGEDAYEYGVQELGAEHPWTLRTAKDLAIAKRRAGLVEEALELAERTFELQERAYGLNHPDTLAAALCLANAERAVGRVQESLSRLVDMPARFSRMYGEDHPFTYGCDTNLALLLRVNDQVERALEIDRRALDGFDRRLGRDHHFSLTCAINVASDLAALGEVDAARRLGESTLVKLRDLLGADHPLTLAGAANLVVDLRALGAGDEAAELYDDTLARYDRVLGRDHPDRVVMQEGRRLDFDFDPPVL